MGVLWRRSRSLECVGASFWKVAHLRVHDDHLGINWQNVGSTVRRFRQVSMVVLNTYIQSIYIAGTAKPSEYYKLQRLAIACNCNPGYILYVLLAGHVHCCPAHSTERRELGDRLRTFCAVSLTVDDACMLSTLLWFSLDWKPFEELAMHMDQRLECSHQRIREQGLLPAFCVVVI